MSLQIELLEQSFNYIKPYGNLFVSNFYDNLFKAHPEIKSLFADVDPETNKDQLWHDLVLVMENLRQPEMLKNLLQGLGARLFTCEVLPKHYPLMKDALFSSFEQFLDSEWTAEFQQAWDDAYVTFRELMLDGAEKTRRQMGLMNPVAELKENIEEEVAEVGSNDDSLGEELLPTPIPELKEYIEEEVAEVSSNDDALGEELLPNPIHEFKDSMEEEVTEFANISNSLTEEVRETSLSESATILEEQVIIEEDIDLSSEKTTLETTMSESDKNISQKNSINDHSDDSSAENTLETPLADLSEKLKSETVEPHFTQIFIPESQSESATSSTATATPVKSVASEKNYQPEIQSNQSKKGLLIGGGVAGGIGLLLLLLL